ncbi:MAG: WXG100 family type VII secretion target [Oscillospiraceae bacterium]|jgi:WXG100 family type VII secretion target|nr:WXG100 family type VII secretion target [Oscillospiraceae bacterium]
MSRGQIMVDTAQLESAAAKIESLAESYHNDYLRLFQTVQDLRHAWSGQDNTMFTHQIEGFGGDFRQLEMLLREYADFLKKSARAYRETQENIRGSVQSLSRSAW